MKKIVLCTLILLSCSSLAATIHFDQVCSGKIKNSESVDCGSFNETETGAYVLYPYSPRFENTGDREVEIEYYHCYKNYSPCGTVTTKLKPNASHVPQEGRVSGNLILRRTDSSVLQTKRTIEVTIRKAK